MMTKNINAGVIGCNGSEDFFRGAVSNTIETFTWKKIYVSDTTGPVKFEAYPNAEIVFKLDSIINDKEIDLVFVSARHLDVVKPIMQAGKSVRII